MYADVLRRDPNLLDAAFNYEYVVKLRDSVAKGPKGLKPNAPPKPGATPPVIVKTGGVAPEVAKPPLQACGG